MFALGIFLATTAGATTAGAVPVHTTQLDEAFTQFWQAEDTEQTAAAVQAILDTGATFDEVHQRLEAGRPYSDNVDTGRVDLTHRTSDRVRHHYRVLVPKSYDSARRYPVRFYLHGGVSRPAWRKGGAWWSGYDRFEDPDRISVFPSSWDSSMWWQARQAENLPAILATLKRTYNVDENAVHMIGISDGATGAYFFAFRAPTPWASFLPFIGHPAVLANKRLGVDGEMYPRNLLDRPFFIVNSGNDRLYPTQRVIPYLDLMQRAGARIAFHPQPEAGHDTSWWPAEAENIRTFIAEHQRDPLPDRLAWETERTDRYHRNHWLLITELGNADHETDLDPLNSLESPPSLGLRPDPESDRGVRVLKVTPGGIAYTAGIQKGDVIVNVEGQPTSTLDQLSQVFAAVANRGAKLRAGLLRDGQRHELEMHIPAAPSSTTEAFAHDAGSGRIELVRRDNVIQVHTQGVRRYKVLLSPDEINFDRPITILTNGRESWNGLQQPSVETLLEWAARDHDRTMLFGAELEIEL